MITVKLIKDEALAAIVALERIKVMIMVLKNYREWMAVKWIKAVYKMRIYPHEFLMLFFFCFCFWILDKIDKDYKDYDYFETD